MPEIPTAHLAIAAEPLILSAKSLPVRSFVLYKNEGEWDDLIK